VIQLNYLTLSIVIGIVSIIAALVMTVLWRFNSFEKGIGIWTFGAFVSTIGFMVLLFKPFLGTYATFLNNTCSLTSPLLILEGILQFKEYGNKDYRKKFYPFIILLFAVLSYINRDNATARYLFHDILVTVMFLLSAYYLIKNVRGSERRVYLISFISFFVIGLGFLYRWYLALSGEIIQPNGQTHGYVGVLFLIIILWIICWLYGILLIINFRAQKRIIRMAEKDDLTGLSNRKSLNSTLEALLVECKENNERFLVFMFDLNGFKMINDTYGHAFGDKVLINMAKSINEVTRDDDFPARLGGDEFICIIKFRNSEGNIDFIKERLRTAVEKAYKIDNFTVQLRTSMGHSILPDEGTTVDDILEVSDKRMYQEKSDDRPMSEVVRNM